MHPTTPPPPLTTPTWIPNKSSSLLPKFKWMISVTHVYFMRLMGAIKQWLEILQGGFFFFHVRVTLRMAVFDLAGFRRSQKYPYICMYLSICCNFTYIQCHFIQTPCICARNLEHKQHFFIGKFQHFGFETPSVCVCVCGTCVYVCVFTVLLCLPLNAFATTRGLRTHSARTKASWDLTSALSEIVATFS